VKFHFLQVEAVLPLMKRPPFVEICWNPNPFFVSLLRLPVLAGSKTGKTQEVSNRQNRLEGEAVVALSKQCFGFKKDFTHNKNIMSVVGTELCNLQAWLAALPLVHPFRARSLIPHRFSVLILSLSLSMQCHAFPR
jgi:hypothetical protein